MIRIKLNKLGANVGYAADVTKSRPCDKSMDHISTPCATTGLCFTKKVNCRPVDILSSRGRYLLSGCMVVGSSDTVNPTMFSSFSVSAHALSST